MNYENFRYDLDNVLRYYEHKFCLDQIVYTFNDKYNQLEKNIFYNYCNKYIEVNMNQDNVLNIIKYINIRKII